MELVTVSRIDFSSAFIFEYKGLDIGSSIQLPAG